MRRQVRVILTAPSAAIEVRLRALKSGDLQLSLKNSDVRALRVLVSDRYGAPQTLELPVGEARALVFGLARSAHWYDLEIRCESLRHRLAGHVETGQASFSEPGEEAASPEVA